MSTNCNIKFVIDSNNEEYPLANVYIHWDGYLEGVGRKLCEWLSDKLLVNGVKQGCNYANGFECLVAKFVHDFKTCVGNVYLYPMDVVCDFNYKLIFDSKAYFDKTGVGCYGNEIPADELIKIEVRYYDSEPFFVGTPSELAEFIEERAVKEDDDED